MNAAIEPHHLVVLLASPSERVRVAARSALRIQGPQALDALRAGLHHESSSVRRECRALLRELTPRRPWTAALRERFGAARGVPLTSPTSS